MLTFKSIARLTLIVLPFPLALMSTTATDSMHVLRDFETPTEALPWPAKNDGVMGGISTGKAEMSDGVLHFTGKISLKNNGGFAQIYSLTQATDFSSYSAVRLRVKGDGRSYQFRLATDARYRGSRMAYRAGFSTQADEWIEVSIPFSSFVPSHHGNLLSGPSLDLTTVREITFLLGDGKPGPFALQVKWIGLEPFAKSRGAL
jgi:NADH dehydrogenase [ubiquinone] 1 alpha subcomplex assembly factor 1